MQIVARKFTHAEFSTYLDGLTISNWAKFVVVHNTSVPDIALYHTWEARQGKYANWTPEQWLRNLSSYYSGMGWSGGPHLFIPPTPDTILVLNSLLVHGTHTPSWNSFSFGVETVGEFEREPFVNPTKDNLVTALALLHKKMHFDPANFQLGVKGLHFHKEDHATTHKTCPGKNIIKTDLVHAVSVAMGLQSPVVAADAPNAHAHDVPMASQEADTSKLNSVELVSMYWLQAALNQWSPSLHLVVNGNHDRPTEDAIRLFQTSHGLVADGVGGPVTRITIKHANA